MKFIRYINGLLAVIFLLTALSFAVYAEEASSTVDIENSTTQTQEADSQDNFSRDDDQKQLEESLALNKELLNVYQTWTAIISIVLILVTIFGIAFPLYSNSQIDKKINKATKKLREETENILEKNVCMNNALMLSASGDHWASNEILKDILKQDQQNSYLHLLIGRNYFLQYEGENSPQKLDDQDLKNIEDAINHYLFVASHSKTEDKYYELGVIFPNSIIHELCMLTMKLLKHSMEGQCANYHKLTVSVIKAIEKVLGIKTFDDIANGEPTDVHIMNYIILNHELAKSYVHFGNVKAKEQYLYALKLYSISADMNYEDEIKACKAALSKL